MQRQYVLYGKLNCHYGVNAESVALDDIGENEDPLPGFEDVWYYFFTGIRMKRRRSDERGEQKNGPAQQAAVA